ncbi:MAG: hypothetical protein BGN86_03205 [Caulobacterales bacterium 68-7]|nr:MAG: hypothetical protein BGN86_03205 [Caulobacterales bacterium 68-7]
MTAEPASPEETPAADFARPVLERQLARLERLADIGMEIAEALGRRVAEDETLDPAAATLAFGRVSRAVRMTCALQTEVVDKLRGVGRIEAYEAESAAEVAASEAARAAADLRLRARKDAIGSALTDIIEDAHSEDETREGYDRCIREATERLKDPREFGDILSRPFSEVIDQICKDLGLDLDWSELAEEAWAKREVASGKVGRPLRFPSPWMGEGSGMGVAPRQTGAAPNERVETPYPVHSPRAEPLPPPIPALSPIQGERGEAETPQFNQQTPEPYQPPPDPDALPGYPVGLPGELPPDRRSRPQPPPRNYTYGWD